MGYKLQSDIVNNLISLRNDVEDFEFKNDYLRTNIGHNLSIIIEHELYTRLKNKQQHKVYFSSINKLEKEVDQYKDKCKELEDAIFSTQQQN